MVFFLYTFQQMHDTEVYSQPSRTSTMEDWVLITPEYETLTKYSLLKC